MLRKFMHIFAAIVLSTTILTGCSTETEVNNKSVVNVVMPDGLPTVAISKMSNEKTTIMEEYKVEYNLQKSPETLSTSVMKEEADIAIVPSNMAAIAYNKTSNYKIAGTIGEGSFYLVSSENIKELEELQGKEVYNTGKGLTPDITARNILKNNDIDENNINFSYVNATSELVPLMISGKAKTGFVPEPALSTLLNKNADMKIIKSLNDEWKKNNKSKIGYPQSTIIIKSSFIKDNEEFVEMFLEEVSKNIEWTNNNPIQAGEHAKEVGASIEPQVLEEAIKRANLKFTPINESISTYNSYYQTLYDFNEKSVGGKIPDEEIYFIQE